MQTFPGSLMIHCDYINNSEAAPHTQLQCISECIHVVTQTFKREHQPAYEPTPESLHLPTAIKTTFALSDGWNRNQKLSTTLDHLTHCIGFCFVALFLGEFSLTVLFKGYANIYGREWLTGSSLRNWLSTSFIDTECRHWTWIEQCCIINNMTINLQGYWPSVR